MTGKPSYELLKKQIHEEIFDWWCKGWGWSPPISSNIEYEFKNRHSIKNDTYIKELISIKRKLRGYGRGWQGCFVENRNDFILKLYTDDPVINYLLSLRGSIFNPLEISNILEKKVANNQVIAARE